MSDMSSNSNRWSTLVFAGVVSSLTAFAPVFAGEREGAGEKSSGGGTIAWQKGDTVFVEGTRAGDRIVIHRSGDTTVPGEVEVWDVGGGLGTVLGVFTGVENINVDLLAGDNFLGLYRFDVAGDVNVACGDGNNQVNLGGVGGAPGGRTTIDGNFRVNVGTGNDEIRLEQCDIGDVMIDAGDGDNVILFGNHLQTGLAAYHGTILWAVAVLTGSGNDLISMIGCELGSTTTFDTQNGDDWVLLGLGTEGGALTFRGNETGDVAVNVGLGNDLVGLFDNDAYGDIAVVMGNHQDFVWLGGLGAPNDFHAEVAVDGGPGNDEAFDDPANSYAAPPVLTHL